MSGLVDIWTNEMSKLREKEKDQIQSTHSTQHVTSQQKNNTSTWLAPTVQFFKPRLLFSEASLSMLVECFNP
jgi:hypothetical protein